MCREPVADLRIEYAGGSSQLARRPIDRRSQNGELEQRLLGPAGQSVCIAACHRICIPNAAEPGLGETEPNGGVGLVVVERLAVVRLGEPGLRQGRECLPVIPAPSRLAG